MASGQISRLLTDAGFGFILEDGRTEEIEFHWSDFAAGRLEQCASANVSNSTNGQTSEIRPECGLLTFAWWRRNPDSRQQRRLSRRC
jgi:cold shock CspA family protein